MKINRILGSAGIWIGRWTGLTGMLLLGSPGAFAGLVVDNHLFYQSNSISTGASESFGKYLASLFVGASIPKSYFIGWKTTSYSDTQKGSAGTMTLTGLEMGPRAGVFLDKDRWSSLSFTYLPVHSGTYTSDQNVRSSLSGNGFEFEFAFAPEVFKLLSPGISLLYHYGTYSTSTNSSNTTSAVSFKRSLFQPSIYLHWVFGGID